MKSIHLMLLLLFSGLLPAQSIQITDASASAVEGGINVNVQTISLNGAGYLSHSYSIIENTIELSVCYYFNMTLPVLTFNNDFFIPVTGPGSYTVYLTVYNSSSDELCDYHSTGGTAMVTVLSATDFAASSFKLYPNPTENIIRFDFMADISIFDTTGKLVLQCQDVDSVDASPLQSGLYVVRIDSLDRTSIQKLIKR